MTQIIDYIRFHKLMERWNLDESEIHQLIFKGLLPDYVDYTNYSRRPDMISICLVKSLEVERDIRNDQLVFKVEDVMQLEKTHPMFSKNQELHPKPDSHSLNAKEAQELGRLRKEKIKWDNSIKAAIQAAIFCKDQKTLQLHFHLIMSLLFGFACRKLVRFVSCVPPFLIFCFIFFCSTLNNTEQYEKKKTVNIPFLCLIMFWGVFREIKKPIVFC